MRLPITNGFYESRSLPISHQQCANWYVSLVQTDGASEEVLFGTPGAATLTSTGTIRQINRGSWVKRDVAYYVNGNTLYKLNKTVVSDVDVFSTTVLGTIEGSGRVSMAANSTQLMILVPGGRGYIYNEDAGTPFLEITDGDFTANGQPQMVVFVDGYFMCTTDSRKFIVSSLNNGMAWDPLDVGTAEADPDAVVAPVVVANQVFILGTHTAEGFQNVGGSGFPFKRANIFLDKGCASPFTLVKSNQTFFMVGSGKDETPAIWRFTGNNFQRISTPAIDRLLSRYSIADLNTAFGFAYAADGAYFVGWTFPDLTIVFDQASQKWHERTSTSFGAQSRWRVNSIVSLYGKILVGDNVDGRIGELSLDLYTEYGSDIIRIVSTQPFSKDGREITSTSIELTMESGVGNAAVKDPSISLATSKDAKIFGYERVRKIGKIGEYEQRIVWRKNGRFPRYVVLKFTLSDAVKPVIIKLEAA